MKKKLFAVFLSIFVSASFYPAVAQETPNLYALIDTDKDGKVSRDEFITFQIEQAKKRGLAIFMKADANSDGVLSSAEFEKVLNAVKEKLEQRKNK